MINSKEEKNISQNEKKLNYNNHSQDELVSILNNLINKDDLHNYFKEIEIIKSTFYKNINETNLDLENNFKKTYQSFKSKKRLYRIELQKKLNNNLNLKKEILNNLEKLLERKEIKKDTLKEFYLLREKWKKIGEVPISERNELWNSFMFKVELFYDYLKINNELRDLDFKKNLVKKTEICEKAEKLKNEVSIRKANQVLQSLHNDWKIIGPVEKKYREIIWQRFQNASKFVNKKRNDYYLNIKLNDKKNNQEKNIIIDKIKKITKEVKPTHNSWQKASEKIKLLEKKWREKSIHNKIIRKKSFKSFYDSINNFNSNKNNFYRKLKLDKKKIIIEKKKLIKEIELIKNSQDWKTTTTKIIDLQLKWKNIQPIYDNKSNELWQEFNNSCNYFFNQKKDYFIKKEKSIKISIKKCNDFLKKLKNLEINNLKDLSEVIKKWFEINQLNNFKTNNKFEEFIFKKKLNFDISKDEIKKIIFNNKLILFKNNTISPLDEIKIINLKIIEIEKELNQYQNNINFFSNSSKSKKLILEINEKIEQLKKDLIIYNNQIKILNKL